MTADKELYKLFDKVKAEGNCKNYVNEMCSQLELFGTESNTLTKQMIYTKLKEILLKVEKSLK